MQGVERVRFKLQHIVLKQKQSDDKIYSTTTIIFHLDSSYNIEII